MAETGKRFWNIDAEQFTVEQQNVKTKQATKYAINVLKEFMAEKNIDGPIDVLQVNELNDLLSDFYANCRNVEGEFYSKSTMIAIRQGIRRYLQKPPLNRDYDIIKDARFNKANGSFKSMLKKVRQEGKGVVQHKNPIQPGQFISVTFSWKSM